MKIHHLSAEEALQSLHSSPTGLTTAEAARRLHEFGPNRVERLERTGLLVRFLRGFIHFFALILWIAAGLAFLAEWQDPGTGMVTLGIAILGLTLGTVSGSIWAGAGLAGAMARSGSASGGGAGPGSFAAASAAKGTGTGGGAPRNTNTSARMSTVKTASPPAPAVSAADADPAATTTAAKPAARARFSCRAG